VFTIRLKQIFLDTTEFARQKKIDGGWRRGYIGSGYYM